MKIRGLIEVHNTQSPETAGKRAIEFLEGENKTNIRVTSIRPLTFFNLGYKVFVSYEENLESSNKLESKKMVKRK